MSEKSLTEEHVVWEVTRTCARYFTDEEGRVVIFRYVRTGAEDKYGPYGELALENGQTFRIRVKEVVS